MNRRQGKFYSLVAIFMYSCLLLTSESVCAESSSPTPTLLFPASGSIVKEVNFGMAGTAPVNSTLEILCDGFLLAKTNVGAFPFWAITNSLALADGRHQLVLRSVDAVNGPLLGSQIFFTLDSTAPAAPEITSPRGGLSLESLGAVEGKAEPGSTIILLRNGVYWGTSRTAEDGLWHYKPSVVLGIGSYILQATATDVAGNTSPPSNQVAFSVVSSSLTAPRIISPVTDSLTNRGKPAFSGLSTANTRIDLLANGHFVGMSFSDDSGAWSYQSNILWADGEYSVIAQAVSVTTNQRISSEPVVLTIDSSPPTAPGILGVERGKITFDSTNPFIEGKAEPLALVRLSLSNSSSYTKTVSASGYWSIQVNSLTRGSESSLEAVATDNAGNTSEATIITVLFKAPDVLKPVDSDGDGVSDQDENLDNTDPEDRGSFEIHEDVSLCTLWQEKADSWSVLETGNGLSRRSTLIQGWESHQDEQRENILNFRLPALAKRDLLLSAVSNPSPSPNLFCLKSQPTMEKSKPFLGRYFHSEIMTYQMDQNGQTTGLFRSPLAYGLKGKQFVSYNTFQPSLSLADQDNLVKNTLFLVNPLERLATGELVIQDAEGRPLASTDLDVPPASWREVDISGVVGPSVVGLISWSPRDESSRVILSLHRQEQEGNQGSGNSTFSLRLTGAIGSGQELGTVVDTREGSAILEMANVLDTPISVQLEVLSRTGQDLLSYKALRLAPRQSKHVILDGVIRADVGSIRLRSSAKGSLIANVVHYPRNPEGSIRSGGAYSFSAVEARRDKLLSSFNTFLGQENSLVVVNNSNTEVEAKLDVIDINGQAIGESLTLVIDAKSTRESDISVNLPSNVYGQVLIRTTKPGVLSGVINRYGPSRSWISGSSLK